MFDHHLLEHPVLASVLRDTTASPANPGAMAVECLKAVYMKFTRATDQWNILSEDIGNLHRKYDSVKQLDNSVHLQLWDIEVSTKKSLCDLLFTYLLEVTDLMERMISEMQRDKVLTPDFDLDSFMGQAFS